MSRIGGAGLGGGIQLTEVVKNLLIINGLFFLATAFLPVLDSYVPDIFRDTTDFLGMHYFFSPEFKPFQIITSMFTHGGIMHILFNMMGLVFFGPPLEMRWGPKRFLFFYIITGIGATLLHAAVASFSVYQLAGTINPAIELVSQSLPLSSIYTTPLVGASGAIYGILVAFAMYFPNVEMYIIPIPFPVKAKYLVFFSVVFALFMGISGIMGKFPGDNIAHFAHLGGALVAFFTILLWRSQRAI